MKLSLSEPQLMNEVTKNSNNANLFGKISCVSL